MKLFELSELQATAVEENKSESLSEKFINTHVFKVESLKQLVKNNISPGEIFFLWTLNSFNAFTFIPFVIKNSGIINELIICTYSINRRIIDSLMRFVESKRILSVTIFISDSIKYRLPAVFDHLQAITLEKENIVVKYAWNHSKIALARSMENYFVFEGSGNFSENAQYEQYILLNSKNVYEFRRSCIEHFNS